MPRDGASEAAATQPKPWDRAARSIERAMRLSSALLVLAGYLALAATDAHSGAIVLIPLVLLALMPLGEWLDSRTKAYRYFTVVVTALFGISLPMLVRVLGLLQAVVVLFIFIQAHKLLHTKRARDYYQVYLMAFFMLVAACAQEPGAGIGLALVFFLVSAVWAFIMRQVQTEAAANESWATADLVNLGVQESLDPMRPRSFVDRNLVVSVMGLSLICVVLTMLLFIAMPRVEAGILGGTGTELLRSSRTRTGLGREVDIARGGTITPDYEPVMRVEFPDEPGNRYDRPLYWRQTSYDTYWGSQWRRLGIRRPMGSDAGAFEFDESRPETLTRSPIQNTRVVKQKVYLEDVHGRGLPPFSTVVRGGALPALSLVNSIATEGASLHWSPLRDFTVIAAGAKPGLSYEAESEVLDASPGQLRAAGSDYGRLFRQGDLMRLTRHDLQQRSVDLARQLTRDADNVFDKVTAIESWLSSSDFQYTLSLPALPQSHPVDAFIHDVRRGHCQRFATAMAQMVRSLGIPARVVSGYRGGEWFPGEKAYIVRRDMAHLWVEVYFADHGWVTFDPSPPAGWASPLSASGALARLRLFMGRQSLMAKMFWYQNVVGYRGRVTAVRVLNLATASLPFGDRSGRRAGLSATAGLRAPALVLGLAAVAVLGWVLFGLRRGRTRPATRKNLTPDQRRAMRVYRQLKRRLSRHGAPCAGRTAGEILRDVASSGVVPAEPVRRIVEAYNAARFGGSSLSRRDYAGLSKAVRTLRRSEP